MRLRALTTLLVVLLLLTGAGHAAPCALCLQSAHSAMPACDTVLTLVLSSDCCTPHHCDAASATQAAPAIAASIEPAIPTLALVSITIPKALEAGRHYPEAESPPLPSGSSARPNVLRV